MKHTCESCGKQLASKQSLTRHSLICKAKKHHVEPVPNNDIPNAQVNSEATSDNAQQPVLNGKKKGYDIRLNCFFFTKDVAQQLAAIERFVGSDLDKILQKVCEINEFEAGTTSFHYVQVD